MSFAWLNISLDSADEGGNWDTVNRYVSGNLPWDDTDGFKKKHDFSHFTLEFTLLRFHVPLYIFIYWLYAKVPSLDYFRANKSKS